MMQNQQADILAMGAETASKLSFIVAMFPSRKADVLQLALSDPKFRDLVDDLFDAKESLGRLAAPPDSRKRVEIAEYRAIIAELEAEVRAYFAQKIL